MIDRCLEEARARPPHAARPLDALRVLLFLLTVLTVSRIHMHFPVVSNLRPALLLAAAAGLYALLNPKGIAPHNLRAWPAQVVVALAVAACLSVPFGIAMGRSAQFIVDEYSKVLIYTALLMVAIRSSRDLFLFIWAYVVGCAVLAGTALFVFDLAQAPGGVLRLNHLYTYDANDAGLVLTVGLPLALLAVQTSKAPGKLIGALALLGMGAALARTGSRGAFVALFVVAIALLLSWPRASVWKRMATMAALGLALVVAAPSGYWEQMKTLANPTEDYNWESINGRKAVTLRGLGYMLDYPLFGVGIHNFERAEGTISEKAKESHPALGIRWTAPHNTYIQFGAELGIPGLLLWLVLIFGGIAAPTRLRRHLPADWLHGDREERFLYLCTVYLPIAFLGFAIASLFLSFGYLDPAYILASYLTGLYASRVVQRRRDRVIAPEVVAKMDTGAGRIGAASPVGSRAFTP